MYVFKPSNISRKGLCLLTYEKLKEKTCLDLELDIPGFSRSVKTTGQVVWIKELKKQDAQGRRQFYIGIRFLKIAPESEAILLTHLGTLKTPEGR
ncbi:MAG: PilZ domain-containing protein [Candidatus Omnitrophota bacterium]